MQLAASDAQEHYNRGRALLAEQGLKEAAECFLNALRLNPSHFEAAEYLGKCFFDVGAFDHAITTFQHARQLKPTAVGVRLDLAGTFAAARQFDRAIAEYHALLREQPDLPDALSGLATVLASLGQFAEAHQLFERALVRDPSNESARFHYAPLLLRAGEFAKGWPHYELRWMSGNSEEMQRQLPGPRWSGEPLAGKRLLITCEQGLGDELMFASLFPELLAEADTCTIECDERLEGLFRRSFPKAVVFPVNRRSAHWYRQLPGQRETLPPFDYWTPAGSIPLHRRTDAAQFPKHSGYLQADTAKVARWKDRLAALGPGVKVGLSWRGGTPGTWTELRSLALAQLQPLLTLTGVQFISLQYGETKSEIDGLAAATGIQIHHWEDALADYDETAALVSAVDIVVSVCTAIVHLSGALGRAAWVMVPFVPEWRYGQHGSTMIWYPSVRLFRQKSPGDWTPVLTSVVRHLLVLTARRAVEAQPQSAQARFQLGNAMLHAGDPDGEAQLVEAMGLDAGFFDAPAALGRYLFQCGEYTRAAPILAKASALRPENPEVRLELADSYLSSRQFEKAAAEFDYIRREHPDRPVALAGLAVIHAANGRYDQARGYFERALERQPDSTWIGFQYSLFLLRCGDFARGWQLYEVRRRSFLGRDVFLRPLQQPTWDGGSLAGKRLLITAEQGLGDEIMFASTYAELVREAAHCIIECDHRLVPLIRRSFPTATVFGADRRSRTWNVELERNLASLPAFDCWIPSGTLPLYRRRSADQFPRHAGYFKADEARVQHTRERLRSLGKGLKIGISWRGGTAQTNTGTRSMTLERLRPLLSLPNVKFVSLQYGNCDEEIATFEATTGIKIHHWQDVVDDYDETAALVSALDLVVSVCTAVVHLTGALGRPAWVMAPFVPEWRYGHKGTSMIWYPSVRLFRQPALDEWDPVITEITTRLHEIVR